MMKLLTVILLTFCSLGHSIAQQDSIACAQEHDSLSGLSVVVLADTPAEPVGGKRALMDKLSELEYSGYDNHQGSLRIYLEFVMDSLGHILAARCIKGDDWMDITPTVIEKVKELEWKPAKCNGRNVASKNILPIIIHLD